ncbi:MAG TPA: lyase family protein, partial [bacterium]|nr:lyase family protein [bacterium]
MNVKSKTKLWAGRFEKKTDKLVEKFTESISFDKRLFGYDIQGSIAHIQMLAKQKIVSEKDKTVIVDGLKKVLNEINSGKFVFSEELEDIHMHIESRLSEIVGKETGGRLHTPRSRNDQVVLDV